MIILLWLLKVSGIMAGNSNKFYPTIIVGIGERRAVLIDYLSSSIYTAVGSAGRSIVTF